MFLCLISLISQARTIPSTGNIALDYVFTEHSHTTASSRLAIDGDASTCTKVENGKSKPWWRIWLSNTYTITELEIIINESYKGI